MNKIFIGGVLMLLMQINALAQTKEKNKLFTESLMQDSCTFTATGRNMYFGRTIEISRNYFAFCKQTSSIYYFGEEVDMYKNGKIVSHEGAWIAGGSNKAGVMMPGLILMGARYYQEIAPGVAMDRAEIISIAEQLKTHAGTFINCLKCEETTPLEPKNKEYKLYAPGIGLIKDGDLLLVKYGFIN